MRVTRAGITESYHAQKLYKDFLKDTGRPQDEAEGVAWFYRFSDPSFVCLLAQHGRQPVGMIWGRRDPHSKARFLVEGVIIRRKWRKQMKYIRPLVVEFYAYLADNGIKRIRAYVPKLKYRLKNVETHILAERDVRD